MTPQEFFKKDLFAENAGVVLLEVREGYSKAKLEIKPEHLNAGARTQGGAIFTLADLHSPQLPIRTEHSLSLFHPQSLFCVPAVRATPSMPRHANGISAEAPAAIK